MGNILSIMLTIKDQVLIYMSSKFPNGLTILLKKIQYHNKDIGQIHWIKEEQLHHLMTFQPQELV